MKEKLETFLSVSFHSKCRAFTVLILICIAVLLPSASAGGSCDKIENKEWNIHGTFKTCFMPETVIDSDDFLITSDQDETIEGFNAGGKGKLQQNIGAKFPNLVVLDAESCSIKNITKEDFRGLHKLRQLRLDNNEIETIDDDTFGFIPAVEYILLSE